MRPRVQLTHTTGLSKLPRIGLDVDTTTVGMLLQRSARGNRRAFSQMYDIMALPVYAVILTHTTNRAQAERLLLEVFLGLWERCPLYSLRTDSAVHWILTYAEQTVDYDELAPQPSTSKYS